MAVLQETPFDNQQIKSTSEPPAVKEKELIVWGRKKKLIPRTLRKKDYSERE